MPSTLNTLIEGVNEIQRGNFSIAIELLEEYCQNYKTDSEGNYSEYIYAQQHIVKAYGYLGDKAKAIQRTKELATNGHPQVRKWAKRVLAYLSPEAYQSLPQEVIESDNQPLWDSESAKLVLHSVNDYLEFGSNSHLVETLETACESLKFNTKEHLYAQVLLIEAYHVNGQFKNAAELCNQLLDSNHYVTRLLANQYLSSLSQHQSENIRNIEKDTGLLTYTQALVIYQQGYNALIDKNYAEAFEIFEKYCESALPGTREYLEASKYLVHFYQNSGEFERATSFCIKLITSKHKPSQRWARELLYTDLFCETPPNNTVDTLNDYHSKIDLAKNENPLLQTDKPKESPVINQEAVFKPFRLKTIDEFKQFCKQHLLKHLKVFETRRKQAFATIIVCHITVSLILICLFQLSPIKFFQPVWSNDDIVYTSFFGIAIHFSTSWFQNLVALLTFSVIYLIIILILFIIYTLFYNSTFDGFIYKFDDTIIQKIYHFINTNQSLTILTASSEKQRNQTLAEVRNSQLLNGLLKPNYIQQNHLIYGNINNIEIEFATVNINSGFNHSWTTFFDIRSFIEKLEAAQSEASTNLAQFKFLILTPILIPGVIILLAFRLFKGVPYVLNRVIRGKNIDFQRFQTEILKNESYNAQVFKGLFFTANFNKYSKAVTIIRPKLLKTNLNSLYYGKKQLIKLEDPEFNSLFTVYSEDQVQARYILSTSLMEKLVQFRKKANKNIYVSFVDDTIYIAIEYPEGIFEPNLFKSMLKFAPLREYFEATQLMLGIVEDFKLDRQIWKSNL